ncbi:MAG: hypothetical protein K9W45_08690 [Candidatus Heimdallarchaeum aukensis]|uniref:Uncharacterized protein n=1 Tax=Candidatus Heimdallarchaeum aukensis TaxID=2876573 RepID=A0A9Y1BJI6_9ARCH|nr:MAG: hypothetical protein K9W45_08690 [Candidatus Heimdallarchaeum aukensis]
MIENSEQNNKWKSLPYFNLSIGVPLLLIVVYMIFSGALQLSIFIIVSISLLFIGLAYSVYIIKKRKKDV